MYQSTIPAHSIPIVQKPYVLHRVAGAFKICVVGDLRISIRFVAFVDRSARAYRGHSP